MRPSNISLRKSWRSCHLLRSEYIYAFITYTFILQTYLVRILFLFNYSDLDVTCLEAMQRGLPLSHILCIIYSDNHLQADIFRGVILIIWGFWQFYVMTILFQNSCLRFYNVRISYYLFDSSYSPNSWFVYETRSQELSVVLSLQCYRSTFFFIDRCHYVCFVIIRGAYIISNNNLRQVWSISSLDNA